VEYSERFKAEMVRKMTGPSAMSANLLSKECGVGQPTLSKWLREAKLRAMTTEQKKPSTRKTWPGAEKLRVVLAAAAAGENGRGELLRREGLHEADLKRFEEELASAVEAPRKRRDASDKKRIQQLERELRRKDRALAEATALVVLSKKLNAYFEGGEVGDTDEDSER
jgi:transposase